MNAPTSLPVLKAADFASDQLVRWCPGCGDYSILTQMRKVFARLGKDRSRSVFVSGIGCSSRFPYYMNTYGFHTIHGRAPTIATGLKLARPDLDVWVITGDGDGFSIGGNHLIHAMRRNVDLKVLLFNNRIYGLTKGQYSPTSEQGKVTRSTPAGSPDAPLNPLSIALACNAGFVARTVDVDLPHLDRVLERAAAHRGLAFVEIYQNCPIFNDKAFEAMTDKSTRHDAVVYLEPGQPMTFAGGKKGIRLDSGGPRVVSDPADATVHDPAGELGTLLMLARMTAPEFPQAVGVFRDVELPIYDQTVRNQLSGRSQPDLQSLLTGPETWTVRG
jgi:2-oxoglutarate ferredoxin oxidoreductase subunit beta